MILLGLGGAARRGARSSLRAVGSGGPPCAGIVLPFIANTPGWIFTEVGRQPWIVYGVMVTGQGRLDDDASQTWRSPRPPSSSCTRVLGVVDV